MKTTFTDVSTVCELQGGGTGETGEGEISESSWRAYFLAAEDMGSKPGMNKLAVDGVTYEFVGRPDHVWDSLRGVYDHWKVNVEVAE